MPNLFLKDERSKDKSEKRIYQKRNAKDQSSQEIRNKVSVMFTVLAFGDGFENDEALIAFLV